MASLMDWFKIMLVVQLFYSFSITVLAYSLPPDALNYVSAFSEPADDLNLQNITNQVQGSLEQQTNIPVIELGALVFYSGNILIDLLLNFLFAVPQMLGLLINGIMLLLNVDNYLFVTVQLFSSAVVTVLYILGIIQLLTAIRSGRDIV